ncbi:MAG: hypothetical protein ACOYN0_18955, partial [Phycisphaerales bacterium]
MRALHRMLGLGTDCGYESLEPRAMLAADLAVTVDSVSTRFDWLIPGDSIFVDVTVENVGDAPASGQFDLVLQRYLDVEDSGLDDLGSRRYTLNLVPGARATFARIAVTVDDAFVPGRYFIAATAEIPTNSATPIDDEDLDNNTGFSAGTLDLTYRFGT